MAEVVKVKATAGLTAINEILERDGCVVIADVLTPEEVRAVAAELTPHFDAAPNCAGDFYGYVFEGKRYDAGEKLGYLKATVDYALRHPALADEFREYLKSLFDDGKATQPSRPAARRASARR